MRKYLIYRIVDDNGQVTGSTAVIDGFGRKIAICENDRTAIYVARALDLYDSIKDVIDHYSKDGAVIETRKE